MLPWFVVVALIGAVAAAPDYSVSVTEEEIAAEPAPPPKPSFDPSSPPMTVHSGPCGRREQDCFENQADFQQQCTLAFNGVVNGGRCFFMATDPTDWNGQFEKCKALGAQSAQYHTQAEFDAATKYFTAKIGAVIPYQWCAMRRHTSGGASPPLNQPYTWWHKSPTERHSRLSAGNTWSRVFEKTDTTPNGYCIVVYGNHRFLGDNPCEYKYSSICVYHNLMQTFTYVKGICNDEVPIETRFDISVKECAKVCADNSIWCRSFNYYSNFSCDLFSFVVSDTNQKSNKSDCFHYSYRP